MSGQGDLFAQAGIADQAARDAALDPRRSFIVQAPAGSGKTGLLVRRYLKLLPLVKQPEEILAITFTIKAAAEMRKRVLDSLAAAGRDPGEAGPRLRVQTIDAFCGSLVRRMPVLSTFGAQPDIVEDASEHYREAAARTIRALSPAVEHLLAHLDNNVEASAELIASMLARRDQWLRKTGVAPTRSALERNLSLERKRVIDGARALHPKASPGFADEVLTQGGDWRKRNPEAQALSDNEPLRLALVQMRRLPPERYSDAQWETLGAVLQLLPLAAAQLKVVFAERGQCDFTEIAQGAVRALGTAEEPTDLLLALDYRIRHILVDEFQDTSWSQWELLERLTAGWQEGEGRSLFLVGDPMQSIYRFREAEVALFLKAQREGLGGVRLEKLTLTTNFRSQAGLVDFYNAAFPQIFPAQADESSGAVPYSAASAHPERKAEPQPVTWHALPDRRAEAARVLDLVSKGPQGRTAILVRNRASLADIVPALRKAGIRYRAVEIEQLGERQVVQDLFALTRALTHLGDRVAWLALLRAPWVGLTLEKIQKACGENRFATVWELIQGVPELEKFRGILGAAIAQRGRGTLRDLVEGTWLALGGPACVEDRTDLEDAEIFLDALDGLEAAGGVDFAALAAALERLFALPDVAAGDDDLQIMTVHKAKGLEFDTVIVPGLDKGPGRGDPPLFLWKERAEGGLLLAPIKETGGERDAAYSYLARLETEAEDTESSRLLYVAATRARRRLHLLACLECEESGEVKKPRARSLLEKAWPVAERHMQKVEAAVPAVESAASAARFKRLAATAAAIAPAARWTPPPEGRIEDRIEFSWVTETARHVGTVVHRWLQRIAEDQMRGWDAGRIAALEERFSVQLESLGVPQAERKDAVRRVMQSLANTLADERGRWLLGPQAEARAEYRLRTAAGATYVIDRCFRDAQGELWVVDWKTGQHQGRDLEGFLDSEQARHAPQLERYAAVLNATRLGLYFPALARWREWKK